MSFPSPFAGGTGSAGSAFAVPGQRRQEDADVEVVVLAGVPRVDLLPAAVAAGDRFRRLQLGLAAGLTLVLVGAAAATLLTGSQVSAAEEELAVHQSRTVQLQNEQAQYAEVPLLRAQSAALTEARDAALARDVLWHRYAAHLANELPADLRLTSMTMQLGDAVAAPAVDAAGAVTPVEASVGGLTLSLEGRTVPDSADLLDVLAATPGVTGPWADSTTAVAEGGTTVQAHADLSSAALSGRYTGQGAGTSDVARETVTGAEVAVAPGAGAPAPSTDDAEAS
ncbi:hypothetical protein [uncultured Pseudokineococcus sp.]|uniref:hypothetical protein n=1 Tax=uncultured Pseudokineococcus sp. TaxID=1642928 RepID=UPI0026170294|nr:hypothetical protein [uncultured Pseudokineococcus sp.]